MIVCVLQYFSTLSVCTLEMLMGVVHDWVHTGQIDDIPCTLEKA